MLLAHSQAVDLKGVYMKIAQANVQNKPHDGEELECFTVSAFS